MLEYFLVSSPFPYIYVESFGWLLLNSEFICVIDTVPIYLGKWGKRVNFGNGVAKIQHKYERGRGREKILNFGNVITEIPAPRTNCMCSKKKPIVALPLPK